MTAPIKKRRPYYYMLAAFIICMSLVSLICQNIERQEVLSKVGSSGKEVSAIQEALKERGLFSADITGYYGTQTRAAVKKFQRQKGLTVDGNAGPQSLCALGISVGTVPKATESNINLLARIISAEARGEPYTGQVAVGAVVLNRVQHPSFPDTISGVIYQNGAFTAVDDGQFWEPCEDLKQVDTFEAGDHHHRRPCVLLVRLWRGTPGRVSRNPFLHGLRSPLRP